MEAVADSRHTVAVLGAPIRAGLAGVCAEISEDGAGEMSRHRREGLLNACLRGEAGDRGRTHGEDDGIDPADVRVATRSEGGRQRNCAKCAGNAVGIRGILLLGVGGIPAISCGRIDAVGIGAKYSARIGHCSRIYCADGLPKEVSLARGDPRQGSCIAKLCEAAHTGTVTGIKHKRTSSLVAVVAGLIECIVNCVPSHIF